MDNRSNRTFTTSTSTSIPCPSSLCPDPIGRLSRPTHNSTQQSFSSNNTTTTRSHINNYNSNDNKNHHKFISYGQGSVYNKRKKLIAVRRLRIINMMIECSADVPHLIECSQPSTLALLITRQILNEKENDNEYGKGMIKSDLRGMLRVVERKREEMVHCWAMSLLQSSLTITEKYQKEREIVNYPNKSRKDAVSSTNIKNISSTVIESLEEAARQPVIHRLMQLLCGVINIMRRRRIEDRNGNIESLIAMEDEQEQVRHLYRTVFSYDHY